MTQRTRQPTILDTLRERVRVINDHTGKDPENLHVTKDELHNYITLYDDINPTYSTDDLGRIIPQIGEMPLKCSFRGIPLICEDPKYAGS
ncbi:MAG: hypothetical protein GWN55_05760 [Phycisphaerae bacterium]|nr:hypothetical protein [Phycisphaerae bacterium]